MAEEKKLLLFPPMHGRKRFIGFRYPQTMNLKKSSAGYGKGGIKLPRLSAWKMLFYNFILG